MYEKNKLNHITTNISVMIDVSSVMQALISFSVARHNNWTSTESQQQQDAMFDVVKANDGKSFSADTSSFIISLTVSTGYTSLLV